MTDPQGGEDYYGGDFLQDVLETALLEVGGQALLDRAHDAAAHHVDRVHPWNHDGDEPPERISSYCAVLAHHLDAATSPPDPSPSGHEPAGELPLDS